MQHPDEGTIHTWLDGELPPDHATELEAHVAECTECAAAVAEARGFIAGSSRIVSALDIVPGDVIPITVPRKRIWYSSTQFRAAAAVLFVAGASLLLLRDGRQAKMATAMDSRVAETAPVQTPGPQRIDLEQDGRALKAADPGKDETSAAKAVESQLEQQPPRPEKRSAANTTAPTQAAPGVGSLGRQSAEADRRSLSAGQNAGASVAAAPPAAPRSVAPPPPAPPIAPLRVVRADTTGATVRTTFEVTPGVQVTLTENRFADASAASIPRRQITVPLTKSAERGPSPRATSVPIADATRVDSITWVSAASGRSYVLRGPLTKEQLTVLRSRLPQGSR